MSLNKAIIKIYNKLYLLLRILGSRGYLNFIPDDLYIKLIYKYKMNKSLNLDNPSLFNEKLQWLKLNDRKYLYTKLVDKYGVREYISEKIGKQYLIPLIGVYDRFEDINFDRLPNKFVLKTTHDSGGVVICRDKSNFNINKARKKLNKSLRRNYYYTWREWPYKYVKPRIICEEYMKDKSHEDLKDYKFMCFNGSVKCILVCSDRNSFEGVKMDFYDEKWNRIKCKRPNHPNSIEDIEKPKNLDEMLDLSIKLSSNIPFIRVDFYEVNGKIYFGELTFYPASGFDKFDPDIYDKILGDWLKLPEQNIAQTNSI